MTASSTRADLWLFQGWFDNLSQSFQPIGAGLAAIKEINRSALWRANTNAANTQHKDTITHEKAKKERKEKISFILQQMNDRQKWKKKKCTSQIRSIPTSIKKRPATPRNTCVSPHGHFWTNQRQMTRSNTPTHADSHKAQIL